MERLPQAEDVTTWKAIWKTQFDHLADYLREKPIAASGAG